MAILFGVLWALAGAAVVVAVLGLYRIYAVMAELKQVAERLAEVLVPITKDQNFSRSLIAVQVIAATAPQVLQGIASMNDSLKQFTQFMFAAAPNQEKTETLAAAYAQSATPMAPGAGSSGVYPYSEEQAAENEIQRKNRVEGLIDQEHSVRPLMPAVEVPPLDVLQQIQQTPA